ncbi:glycosyltransferase 87 family protein [Arsenicicoccus dermatophilus]|uniref:glycosyltransferase 87 family protein n=1 Tax=Arsenicicoccus dermatophilus TaxID=1076331 RepID=UPI001F4C6884|nr:glycosyltransferase 87 family protein [Arsenicicoccus dermatophilus]MCH8612195.1 glycosyltransferase 87 family protein [Arsenicicoccus dermatophilus]
MTRVLQATAVMTVTYAALLALGNTDSRRWLYTLVSLTAWLVFVLVARWFWRGSRHTSGRPARPLALVALAATVVQLPGMLAAPVASTDLNRYVWDGRVQASGVDPYRYVPFDDRLAHLRDPILFPGLRPDEPSGITTEPLPDDREGVLRAARNDPRSPISRPRFLTPYPPVAEAYYTAVSAVTPWSWGSKGFQLAGAGLAVATAVLIARHLRRIGRDPLEALVWAWSPIVVLEAGNGGHVDVLVALLVVLAVGAATSRRHPLLVGTLMGLAAGVKLTPFAMLPAFTPWRRTTVDGHPVRGVWRAVRRSLVVGLTAIGLVVLGYLPHYLAVGPAITGSLDGYLAEEGGENRASLLTLVLPLPVANVVAVLICLGVAAWAVLARGGREDEPALPALHLFGTLLLTTTPVLAWYALPLVALAVLTARWEWLALAVAGACAYGGHGAYPATPVAYAAALLVIYFSSRRRASRPRPAPRTP